MVDESYCKILVEMLSTQALKPFLIIIGAIFIGIIITIGFTTLFHKLTGSTIEYSIFGFKYKIEKKNGKK